MFEILVIFLSLCCLGILVYTHSALIELPPKAKLVCEIWAAVEESSKSSSERREANCILDG